MTDETLFMVVRGDDNGQNFIIKEGLSLNSANVLLARVRKGHKQWYSVLSYSAESRPELVERYSLRE